MYFMPNSHNKVWWKCKNGHEWQASIYSRNSGNGCPYCAGQKVIEGYNDLQTVNSFLANEWNYEKNNGLTPADVTPNSDIKAWWKCSKGHEWQATIGSRHKGSGCPYCSGRKTLKGYNDLQTINPAVAKEWNYERNGDLNPEHFTASSNKKVWWKCSKGHEWQTTINSRNDGCGCPVCSSERKTSFPEYAIVYYLKKYGLEAIHTYKEKGYELDVFIPSKKVAIEYDGYLWHKNRTKHDLDKNQKCLNDGIKLYRIREGLHRLNDSSLDYVVHKTQKDLSFVLEKVLSEIIGMGILIDLNRDAIAIENLRELTEKENSLLFSNPEIAKEWNYEKNGNLKPEHFASNSNKKVWWKCNKGHEWQSKISHRNNGIGCPYCSNQNVLKGYNDLQTLNPILANEWDYDKNCEITPDMVTLGSTRKVWWKCSEGHEWQAVINNRSKGRGCPYCSGRYAIKGKNDLQTINPTLADEWNYKKNNGLTPAEVLPNSDKKVWWKCSNGHEWQATIGSRNKGSGCPICRKNKKG
jgi:DNA-directed RNA polymerase subunit RPC12/RpoP